MGAYIREKSPWKSRGRNLERTPGNKGRGEHKALPGEGFQQERNWTIEKADTKATSWSNVHREQFYFFLGDAEHPQAFSRSRLTPEARQANPALA